MDASSPPRTSPTTDEDDAGGASAPRLAPAPAPGAEANKSDRLAFYERARCLMIAGKGDFAGERGPHELFARLLWHYQHGHPAGARLDGMVGKRYVKFGEIRRRSDRLIWAGHGRSPDPDRDVPSIIVEFVVTLWLDRDKQYSEKCSEYFAAGVEEFWILDRFARDLRVARAGPDGPIEICVPAGEVYSTPLLPGFEFPVATLLASADDWKNHKIRSRRAAK